MSSAAPNTSGSGSVVVVGSINVDVSVRVERLPGAGETLLAQGVRRSGGGKGANQAVAAARAGGAATAMIGCVGRDSDGAAMRAALEADGIDCSAIDASPNEPTGLALITVDAAAENFIVVAAGANARLTVGPAARRAVAGADVVLAQLEVPQTAVIEAACARRAGALFVLNAAPWAPIHPDLLAQVDLLVVNEHEARGLAGTNDLAHAQRLLLEQVPAVVVTLGAAGAQLSRRGRNAIEVPSPRATAVDTTGAGDTFCGVLTAELATGADDITALRRAAAAASLTVERAGAQDSVPKRAQVEDRVAAAYGEDRHG